MNDNVTLFREELRASLNEAECPVSDLIADGVNVVAADENIPADVVSEAAVRYGRELVSLSNEVFTIALLTSATGGAQSEDEKVSEYASLIDEDGNFDSVAFANKIVKHSVVELNELVAADRQELLLAAREARLAA